MNHIHFYFFQRLDVLLTTLAVIVVAVTTEDAPSAVATSINDVDEDVEATVAEVTRRLNADPSLPRLSRPQILSILKEIREKEDDKGRALMVVLPHTVNNVSDEAMADLFTKPPVTAMEDVGFSVTIASTTPTTSRRRPTISVIEELPYQHNHRQTIFTQETTTAITTERPIPTSSVIASSQTPSSVVVTASDDDKPSKEQVSFGNHKVALKKPLPSNGGVPLRRKRPTTFKPPVEVVSSPSSPDDQVMFHVQKPLLQGIPSNHKPSSDAHSSVNLHSKRRPLHPPSSTSPTDNQLYPSYVTKGPVLEALSINQGLFLPTPVSLAGLPNTRRPFTAPTTTTSTSVPPGEGVSASAVDALSPEMKDLLTSLGILPGSNPAAAAPLSLPSPPPPPQPSYDPQHFHSFRPLPLAASPHVEGEMHQLLSEFGLLTPGPGVDTSRSRDHKAFDAADMLPEDMRDVLANLGLLDKDQRGEDKERHRKQRLLDANLTAAASEHIFNPLAINASEEDRGRVAQLLDSVRQFHNLSDDQGPDPLSPDQLDVDADETKNEVKRQNEANVTLDILVISNHTASATNGSSEDAQKAQQQALAESFGGDGDDYDAAVGDEVVQAPRPNGLYFLVDWNSFLEVGEEGKNKVNIRIAPKVGDSRNFLPVTIP